MVLLCDFQSCLILLTLILAGVAATSEHYEEGDVRLHNPNNSKDKGLVEIRVNGRWGPLCGWDIGFTEAEIICKQIGYSEYTSYYSDAEEEFDVYKRYNETFYIGLACSLDQSRINECKYDILIGVKSQCTLGSSYGYAGVTCREEDDEGIFSYGFLDAFRYIGWILMIAFIALTFWIVRNRTYKRRLAAQQNRAAAVYNNGQAVVVPPPRTTATYPVPPPGTYPAQTPSDNPPQYNTVVPQPGSVTYPQHNTVPYPPPGGVPYPPQGTGTPYPPPPSGPSIPPYGVHAGIDNPAFPPSDYTATDASTPAFPPPSYETIASNGGQEQPKT